MARPYLIVAGLIVVAGAVVLLAGAVLRPLWQARAARSWPLATCEIVEKRLVETESAEGARGLAATLRYRYEVGGRTYQGTRHDFRPFRGDVVEAREVRRLHIGARVPCHVDPDDPAVAVLAPRGWAGFPASIVLGVAIAGIALVAAGAGKRPRRRRTTRRRDGGVEIRVRGQHGALLAALAALTAVTVPSVVLALGEDRGLLGVGFALLGGLVVVKLVQVLAGFLTGVELVLARAALRPGEATSLRWRVRGRVPSRQGARLIAREEVDYQVDDSHDHEEKIVVEQRLDDRVEVPADAMPTLAAGPCRYRWSNAVTAVIAGWPDLEVELELDVQPPAPGEAVRGVVPVERIDGERAKLQLRWRTVTGRDERETVVARQEIERPPDDGGSPYRASGPPTYSFPDPVHPPAYQGSLFTIDWRIVLVVDGVDVHAIEVPARIAR